MTQNQQNHRRRKAPYLFIALTAVLLVALAVFGLFAYHTRATYNAEAGVTPAPSPTVHGIRTAAGPEEPVQNAAQNAPPAVQIQATAVPQATAAPTPAAPTATPGTMRSGDKGQTVSDLQSRLQALGYYSGKIDGDFGSGTAAAVRAFQRQHGLSDDGIAGPRTLAALYADDAKPYVAPTPVNTLGGETPLLVNKDHPVSEDFEPADLVRAKDILGGVMTYQTESIQGVRESVEALGAMIRAAQADGVTPWKLREGYRTIQDQKRIYNNRIETYVKEGKTRAQAVARTKTEVAEPGASEHHTGLAFDLNVPGENFVDTAQYVWLKKHGWEYGFVLRYTDEKEDITGIVGEEWHVRYVGTEHARIMREMDFCLEEYIDYLNGGH